MIQKETKYNLYNDALNIHRVHMSEGMFFRVATLLFRTALYCCSPESTIRYNGSALNDHYLPLPCRKAL